MATTAEVFNSLNQVAQNMSVLINMMEDEKRRGTNKGGQELNRYYSTGTKSDNWDLEKVDKELKIINEDYLKTKDIIDDIREREKKRNEALEKFEKLRKKRGVTQQQLDEASLELSRAAYEYESKKQEAAQRGVNGVSSALDKFSKTTEVFRRGISESVNGFKQIGQGISRVIGPWQKISQASADYAKNIGLSGKAMDQLRKASIDLVANGGFGIKYGVSVEELEKLRSDYAKVLGRNIAVSNLGQENLAAASKITNGAELMGRMENFGLSMEDAGKRVGKMFASATKTGLVWENYSKAFLDNITLAQRYNFRNGLEGLASMAKKATELKFNMSQVASFAEKVNTVEGAVTTGAQLQVLGGPFAQMANPIAMLGESLMDMEGLQDRMIKMFGNLGTLNEKTGEVNINSFNRRRITEAAKAMGLDVDNVFESINRNAVRNRIDRELRGNTAIDNETAELVKNIGVVQNGKAGVNIDGKFIEASKITAKHRQRLEEMARSESEDIKDIAVRLRGWSDVMEGFKKQKDAVHAQIVETAGIGESVQKIVAEVGDIKGLVKILAIGGMVAGGVAAIGGVAGATRGLSHIGQGLGNIGRQVFKRRGGGLTASHIFKEGLYKDQRALYNGIKDVWTIVEGKNVGTVLKGSQLGAANRAAGLGRGYGLGKKPMEAIARGTRASLGVGGKAAQMIGKAGNIAGWGGLAASLGTDYMVNSGKWQRGGFGDYAGHMGGEALGYGALGATIGSGLGPIGTIAGALLGGGIGAAVGAITATKNKRAAAIEKGGISLNGSYSASALKQIKEAMEGNGEISDRLREKMIKRGDQSALERLDQIKQTIKDTTLNMNLVSVGGKAVKNKAYGGGLGFDVSKGGTLGGNSINGDKQFFMGNAGERVIPKNDLDPVTVAKISPRVSPTVVSPVLSNAPKPMDINMNLNIGGEVLAKGSDGTETTLNIAALLEKKLMAELPDMIKRQTIGISEQLARAENGGRLRPDRGYFYQQG